ncbi:MAG: nucleotidyltransferase family protein [Paracoccaceae bacterium]
MTGDSTDSGGAITAALDPVLLIPAAGASRRMGPTDKLMQPVAGLPLLRRQVRRALATGCPVHVTLSAQHPARGAALADLAHPLLGSEIIDGRAGMSVSLRHGARVALDQGRPLVVVLPDMPDIDTPHLRAFITAAQRRPTGVTRAATCDGLPGHPVWLPAHLLARVLDTAEGDTGAAPVLRGHDVTLFRLPGQRARTDLDTPEAWANWRTTPPT